MCACACVCVCVCMCVCVCVSVCIYKYIYIYRERERLFFLCTYCLHSSYSFSTLLLLLLLLSSSLSSLLLPLFRVFTSTCLMCLTQTVSRVYSVTAVLYLQFVLRVMLFRPWNMLCTFTLALSAVFVQCTIWSCSVVPWYLSFQALLLLLLLISSSSPSSLLSHLYRVFTIT